MSANDGDEQKAGISNLQENFFKQQKKISALKELVLKSEAAHGKSTSSAQEKVKNIAQRLTNLKSKARSRKSVETMEPAKAVKEASTLQSDSSNDRVTHALSQAQSSTTTPNINSVLNTPHPSPLPTPNATPLKPNQGSSANTSLSVTTVFNATPGSEKILLLRQQMEENKLRMAQRASSKQHLEQLVTQLKEKFDSTQQSLEDTSELGRSMTDLSALAYTPVSRERHKSATDLSTQPFNLERERMKFLENRCRLLEKQLEKEKQANSSSLNESISSQATTKRIKELENKVLELEETLSERQPSLINDVNELEIEIERLKNELQTKENIIKNLETGSISASNELLAYETDELNNENARLKLEISEKLKRVKELEDINKMLETTRSELIAKNNAYDEQVIELQQSLKLAEHQLVDTQKNLQDTAQKYIELQDSIERQLNSAEAVASEATKDTDTQIKAEMAKQIQELQNEMQLLREDNASLQQRLMENEKLEVSDATIAEKITKLEATIESQREDLQKRLEESNRYEEEVMEKTIELNVLNANFKVLEEKLQTTNKNKPLFTVTAEESASQNPELLAELQQLKQKLDESNKAMIKLKLKCKQTEKQMEKLRKTTDLHSEVVKLEQEKEQLQHKITELEDEKGQWQLQQMSTDSDSGTLNELPTIAPNELEEKCRIQMETIRLLEQQKYEYTQKLEATACELEELKQTLSHKDKEEAVRVSSEMCELQLEEQLAEQCKKLDSVQTQLAEKDATIEELQHKLDEIHAEKQSIDKKLEHYLTENMELLDKVEKLSKSSSSAESIEIVERLTQQERAEIDEFHKRLEKEHAEEHDIAAHENMAHSLTDTMTKTSGAEIGQELNDSLVQLREESSELMNKIELFTTERREVLEKMELLTAENQDLHKKIEELKTEKEDLETNAMLADNAKSKLELKLQELDKEKQQLATQVAESSAQKAKLSQDLTSLQHSSEVVAVLEGADGITLFDKCEKSLTKLNSELEAYRKANDRNAKFNASKKLAKEAKNAYTQLSELLQKVKEASSAVEMVTVVETVVAVTAPNGKALAEYEQLTAQNRELKALVDELKRDLQEAREDNGQSTVEITELPAITTSRELEQNLDSVQVKEELNRRLIEYEEQCVWLQSTVEDLRTQLQEARLTSEEKSEQLARLNMEIEELRQMSDSFDSLINDKEMKHEKQIEHLTHLRKDLEAKCETYESEMDILQTLIAEQKHQLIEAYKGSEHEMNMKLLDLQQRDDEIEQLRAELIQLKTSAAATSEHLADGLQQECEKLRDALKINKNLVAEQVNELSNKQETVDTLNQQIIDLYKTMEENANKLIEKEDEISYLQDLLESNTKQLETLRKDKDEQMSVVDKLLGEIHSHKTNAQQLLQLEAEVQRLDIVNKELSQLNRSLEQRNKDQLEKLKKYAANLKKRATQCHEYETKIKHLEKGTLEELQTKENQEELQQLQTANAELIAKVSQLENALQESHADATDIRSAIQLKTVEHLESMESNKKLENDLQAAQQKLQQQAQEIEQLQNALAASRDHLSDWENEDVALNAVVSSSSVDNLTEELTAKTASLRLAEQALNEVQNELLQIQEVERTRLFAEKELQLALEEKTRLIADLRNQLSISPSDDALSELQQRLQTVTEELKAKAMKFEKSKAIIKERNNQIHRLQAEIKDLQAKLATQPEEEPIESPIKQSRVSQVASEVHTTLQREYDNLNTQYQAEKASFQKTIARLETLHDGIQAKLQEDLAYIESLEQENTKYKEKICKLEECVGTFEERRSSMERRANMLDEQIQTRADAYEKSEDALIYRLNALAEHDDVIGQRLLDSQGEKEELQERLQQLHVELNELQKDHAQLQREQQTFRSETLAKLEEENAAQHNKLNTMEQEMKQLRSNYDAKLAVKSTEIDELECELSEQLQQIQDEKRIISEDLERARDECASQKDEIVRLNESLNALEQSKNELERESSWLRMSQENSQQDQYELQELRMQTMQDKSELDHLRHQIETLAANHDIELQGLRTQIAELDTLRMQVGQNQTDDQVFIETENKRLTDLLAEKEAQIESYQRQNLQLQMAAVAASAAQQTQQQQPDPFALAFGLPPVTVPAVSSNSGIERELAEKSELAVRLQRDYNSLQSDFHSVYEGNNELKRQLAEKQRELENMRMYQQRTGHSQHQASDVIPAPMFFASEPSPFDDLVPTRALDTHVLESDADMTQEQPTIEDLQRNVSDLEKHAQDLEQKLMLRNQRDGELEERLREVQERLVTAEQRVQDRELQLQQAIMQTSNATQQVLDDLQYKLASAEQQLREREAAFAELEKRCNAERTLDCQIDEQTQQVAVARLAELQANLGQLQQLLQERDIQLQQLQRTLAEETQLKANEKTVESQIIPTPTAIDAVLTAAAPTLEMFFGASNSQEFENLMKPQVSGEPVVEEVIVPKKAYLCQPEEALDLVDAWGDSWGGGQDEMAEAAHFSETGTKPHSLISREQHLEIQILEQQERIQELQMAQERSDQQKQELHLKSGKLMKKLKGYKLKIDELEAANANPSRFRKSCSVESNSMFSDLDATIQEELKTQITQLEARLEEHRKLQESQALEKEKLLKRIDVLTAGNERMSELKERQDMDVQMYQSRIRDLQEKLHKLEEWGDVEAPAVVENATSEVNVESQPHQQHFQQKIATLEVEVKDANDDRLELQALLNEERTNVSHAEETIRSLKNQLTVLENAEKCKFNELKLQNQNLQERCNQLHEENVELSQKLQSLLSTKAEHELNQTSEVNNELDSLIKALETQNEQLKTQNQQLQSTLQTCEQQLTEAQMELLERRTRCEVLEQQNQELREAAVKDDWQQKLDTLNNEKQNLQQALTSLQFEMIATNMQSDDATNPLKIDELTAQLQEKDSEIEHLKQRIEDLMREDQTEKLVLEILTKNQEIHMLKMQVRHLEDDKQELEHNLSLQITKEMQDNKAADSTDEIKQQEGLLTLQNRVQELENDKRNLEAELEVLNNHVLSSLELEDKMKTTVLELDMKNIEIAELRKSLEKLQATETHQSDSAVDFVALNAQWETHVEQKCSEIAQMWREHLEQREKDFKASENKLQEEIVVLRAAAAIIPTQQAQQQEGALAESTATSSASDVSTTASGSSSVAPSKASTPLRRSHTHNIHTEDSEAEADAIIERMQSALECQEMEIVTLKEQLAIRSAEYARLAAQYDPFKLQTTLSHSGMNTVSGPSSLDSPPSRRHTSSGDSSVVPKSELDLALYMLHQRDMRCEEMTLELVSLLEERDTLQLKLSNTLRLVEDIKMQTNYGEPSHTVTEAVASTSKDSPDKTTVAGSTAVDSSDELSQKLSQLQTVNHSKDKVIKEEREQRIRQMEKIQQDVAKMPSEALSDLVGSDLSQSSQSPSSVLLNWLWGNKPQPSGGVPPS